MLCLIQEKDQFSNYGVVEVSETFLPTQCSLKPEAELKTYDEYYEENCLAT